MRILFVTNLFPPAVMGGYEILSAQVAEGLQKLGHEVAVLTSDHPATRTTSPPGSLHVRHDLHVTASFDHPANVPWSEILRCETHNRALTEHMLDLFQPDLVFHWSPLRLTLGSAKAVEEARVPIAYTFNDVNLCAYISHESHGSLIGKLERAKHSLRHALWPTTELDELELRHVTCISFDLKRRLIELGANVAHARVIHQGIPIGRFPAKADPGSIQDPVRILYVGALLDYKGVHTIIDAAQRLGKRTAVELSLVGPDGPAEYMTRLRGLAAGGPAKVDFCGRAEYEALPSIYRAHDFFVFGSSAVEAFGLTHLEAMASGATVIATDQGGHAECLTDGENALLFPFEDAAALHRAFERLIHAPDFSGRLATNARAFVEDGFTFDRYLERIDSWLWEIVGEERDSRVVSRQKATRSSVASK